MEWTVLSWISQYRCALLSVTHVVRHRPWIFGITFVEHATVMTAIQCNKWANSCGIRPMTKFTIPCQLPNLKALGLTVTQNFVPAGHKEGSDVRKRRANVARRSSNGELKSVAHVLTILWCFQKYRRGIASKAPILAESHAPGDNTLSTTPILLKHNTPCLADEDPSVSWRKKSPPMAYPASLTRL